MIAASFVSSNLKSILKVVNLASTDISNTFLGVVEVVAWRRGSCVWALSAHFSCKSTVPILVQKCGECIPIGEQSSLPSTSLVAIGSRLDTSWPEMGSLYRRKRRSAPFWCFENWRFSERDRGNSYDVVVRARSSASKRSVTAPCFVCKKESWYDQSNFGYRKTFRRWLWWPTQPLTWHDLHDYDCVGRTLFTIIEITLRLQR